MDPNSALEIGRQAVFVLIKTSLPLMLVALVVGLAISLLQALTQIQEMTLSFVPKIVAIFVSLVIFMPFMGRQLSVFSQSLTERIISGF